jgi:hypothetical protein
VATLYLLVFQTNFLWWVAEPLREDRAPAAADAIVVFAGGVRRIGPGRRRPAGTAQASHRSL